MAEEKSITDKMDSLNLISFRKPAEIKRLAKHFNELLEKPEAREKETIFKYLSKLNEVHRKIYTRKHEGVEVEYIYVPEVKSNQQRQRFSSISVNEISELLRTEFPSSESAIQVHTCLECNVEIPINDEEPLMESLQKHFDLEVHQKKKVEIDVSEPIVLPNMSRRRSAMERGEGLPPATLQSLQSIANRTEKLDRLFHAKLEAALIRNLPDNSEASVDAAVKYYQGIYHNLCQEIAAIDLSTLTSSVAPIIMSIKDNVNQNFSTDANKNFENDENDAPDRLMKNQPKKFRYYGPIEAGIFKLLENHKLLSLTDDRTGKPAFFCVACEYYTLRFRYDSVLNHVFSETHVHNLSAILESDENVNFAIKERSVEKITDLNKKFLLIHSISEDVGLTCGLCKVTIENYEFSILHILDENHLAKLSDKIFRKYRAANPDGQVPDEWGQKSLDWAKFLAGTGKMLSNKDPVVIENFIKPSGKVSNYCICCDLTLKGPRQVLFNHIRQKKHLRNAAPHKLNMLFKNHCRPLEYYASFGNFYLCSICNKSHAFPSFAAIVEHFDSDMHLQTIAKLITFALHSDLKTENDVLKYITQAEGVFKCDLCQVGFVSTGDLISHVLSDIKHQNLVVEKRYSEDRGDIISVYMQGNYILYKEGAIFECKDCKIIFNSIRSLLMHLAFADHFKNKPSYENIFRFYLELKHNINLLIRNKYIYNEFGRLQCGVCNAECSEGENAKRHVISSRHRESMGIGYVNVTTESVQEE